MIQINPNRTIENNFPDSTPKTATDKFDTIDGGLVNSLTVEMTPVQDLHGQSKPWAGGAGKNILFTTLSSIKTINTSGTWADNIYTADGVQFEVMIDDSNNVQGIKVNRLSASGSNVVFNVTKGSDLNNLINKSIVLNGAGSDSSVDMYLQFYSYNGTNDIVVPLGSDTTAFTPTSGMTASSAVRIVIRTASNPSDVTFLPMARLSTIADRTFEPYSNICPISGHTEAKAQINNTVYTTSLGGTEYGGELDMVSGDGESDYTLVDLSTLTWTYRSDLQYPIFQTLDVGFDYDKGIADNMCSCYAYNGVVDSGASASIAQNYTFSLHQTSRMMWIKDTRYSDAATFATSLTGQTVCIKKATPTTLTLTGQNITAEVGENNVSAPLDGQEIQTDGVTYKEMFSWADVVAYVQSQVNP